MIYPEIRDEAARIAHRALEAMSKHGVPPTPTAYTLWYGAGTDRPPGVTEAVRDLTSSGKTSSGSAWQEVYNRYFGFDGDLTQMQNASARIRKAVDRVRQRLQQSCTESGESTETLAALSGKLDRGEGVEVQSVIASILAETDKILTRNADLEQKLLSAGQEIGDLQERLTHVAKQATTDALTGLANRKHFDSRLRMESEAAEVTGQPLCLLLGDVDHFKAFNDRFGHNVGDQVLRSVAIVLKSSLKGQDLAARYGGEEFAVLLPQTSLEDAMIVGDQIRTSLGRKELTDRRSGDSYGSVTISIGAAQYVKQSGIVGLIDRADRALYAAKDRGRDCVVSELSLTSSAA